MRTSPNQYAARIIFDTEFHSPNGEPVLNVHCVYAIDDVSGERWDLGPNELKNLSAPPWPTGPDVLHVGYALAAEWDAFRCLGWDIPRTDCIDLFYEFMGYKNCKLLAPPPPGVTPGSILNACHKFGVLVHETAHKDQMRQLCIDHRVLPSEAVAPVREYCQGDVEATQQLFRKMIPVMPRWGQAVNRGRFSEVESSIKTHGVPADVEAVDKLKEGLPRLENKAVQRAVDGGMDLFMPDSNEISQNKLARFLINKRIPWERTEIGQLKTDRDYLKDIAAARPEFQPVVDVLSIKKASKTFGSGLAIGSDGRHRFYPAPFRSSTGRSQPGRNVWGLPKAFRSIIKPADGWGFAALDWKSQEVGVSAALSKDEALMSVFMAPDPYLAAAYLCGMAPKDATKKSHGRIRSMFKVSLLAWLYGAGAWRIAQTLGISQIEGRDISDRFRKAFPTYAAWAESMQHHGIMVGELETIHGWRRGCRYDPKRKDGTVNPKSLGNFPVQGAGGDLLRAASVLALRNGVRVVSTVHDAIAIEAPQDQIEDAVRVTENAMRSVCETFLQMPGRTEVTVAIDDRYRDEDGQELWKEISAEIGIDQATLPTPTVHVETHGEVSPVTTEPQPL